MSYFRQLDEKAQALLDLARKDEKWLILINADPDALGSAMALKRMLSRRVAEVKIAHINEISRPDNLAMVQYLRIPTQRVTQELTSAADRFALVDSQPHHNPALEPYRYSIVLDHHPISKDKPVEADFVEIKPEYGANATLLTEYLYAMKIKPGKLLATALLYGIKTDTQSFEREFHDTDVKAFRFLTKHADQMALKKIVRSEYHMHWLNEFTKAFESMIIMGGGIYAYLGPVDNPDILVILADFFLRVHEITWTMLAGTHEGKLVIIFRGDGIRKDMGKWAKQLFDDVGFAGGHKAAARAEIDLETLKGKEPAEYLLRKLKQKSFKLCPLVSNKLQTL
jgi:nanoRNase/pAp phosphatase (c-di-AMP/oligoRNAs hydrolase)